MLAFYGRTWWKKPEYPGETTEIGRATSTLTHVDKEFSVPNEQLYMHNDKDENSITCHENDV